MEKEIITNVKNGLEYHDMHGDNVLYTEEDQIKVIDSDLFEVSYEENFKEKINGPLMELSYSLNSGVFNIVKSQNPQIAKLVQKSHQYYDRGFIKPSDYISELISTIQALNGSSIKTIGDMKRELKLIKGA